jgi:hypothetical protein
VLVKAMWIVVGSRVALQLPQSHRLAASIASTSVAKHPPQCHRPGRLDPALACQPE